MVDIEKDQLNITVDKNGFGRRHLPDERRAIIHKFSIAGHEGYFIVGLYEDGAPGELFVVFSKEGSTMSGFSDVWSIAISGNLQAGVSVKSFVNKYMNIRFDPAGYTKNPKIPEATSIPDYIARWFALKFLSPEELDDLNLAKNEDGVLIIKRTTL